jgi:hypothetical protein
MIINSFQWITNHVKVKLFSICVFLGAAAVWAALESRMDAAELFGATANDVTISDYSPNDLSLVTQIHADRIFADYERRGFFRIGLLPVPVAENVQIQIKSADCLTNDLFALHSWDQPGVGARRFEFRNLEISFFGEEQPRLRAATARVGQNGTIELSIVSLPGSVEHQIPIPHATLQVAGCSAGWLRWNLGGHQEEFFVFKPKSDKTP